MFRKRRHIRRLFIEDYNGAAQEITDYMKTQLPEYMLPTGITNIPSFPLNINGKIDRKELMKLVQNKNGKN